VPVFAALCGIPSAIWPGSTFAHTCYLVCFLSLVVLSWMRLNTIRGPSRRGYTLIVACLTVWVVGDVLHDVLEWLAGPLGDVTPSDVLWVSGYPLLAGGLISLVRVRAPSRLREATLDALAMATVMAWMCWQFVILPAAENKRLGLEVLFGAFYPLGDVVLFAAVGILVLAPGRKRGPTRYLLAALTVTVIGDVSISMLPAVFEGLSRAIQADRFDGVLLFANSLIVAALVHPEADRIVEPEKDREHRLHPARVFFLGIALAALPLFAGLGNFDKPLSRISLIVSTVVLTSLILVRFVLVVREQERVRAELAHQAHHDLLTGLANRQSLNAALEGALARSDGSAYGPVLFYMDLNGFKQVNDRYGHAAGDCVLIEFAERLKASLRVGATAARLGGDEFIVLAEDIGDAAEAQVLADRLRGLTVEPVRCGEDTYAVGVSIGVAAAGDLDRPDADALLAAADSSMYSQKTRTPADPNRATLPVAPPTKLISA
jgi:diguanylate cyclase (GGDEF)-like protein